MSRAEKGVTEICRDGDMAGRFANCIRGVTISERHLGIIETGEGWYFGSSTVLVDAECELGNHGKESAAEIYSYC